MRAVKELARAKINLYLDVVSRRDDGFHEIETVMHTVSLADEITVTLNAMGNRNVMLVLDGTRKLPYDSKNIAYSAAMLFLDETGINADVTVKLKKRIPIAAGLAGGSSDAAAVLRAMNRLFDRMLGERRMLELAAKLGSDVPFCLLRGTQLCRGRGEIITRLPDTLSLDLVIAVAPGEHVSTPTAYGALDKMYSDFKDGHARRGDKRLDGLLSAIEGSGELPELYNIFEDVVLPECKGAAALRSRLLELGASHTLMSGSGPSVFAIFKTSNEAERAAAILSNEGVTAFYATSSK